MQWLLADMFVFQEIFMRPNIARFAMVAGALALLPLASGCARMRAHQGYLVDNLLVDSIQPGVDNRASVERTLGRPSFEAQFNSNEWYYVARDTRQLAFSMPKAVDQTIRTEEHTSEPQSLMRNSYAL